MRACSLQCVRAGGASPPGNRTGSVARLPQRFQLARQGFSPVNGPDRGDPAGQALPGFRRVAVGLGKRVQPSCPPAMPGPPPPRPAPPPAPGARRRVGSARRRLRPREPCWVLREPFAQVCAPRPQHPPQANGPSPSRPFGARETPATRSIAPFPAPAGPRRPSPPQDGPPIPTPAAAGWRHSSRKAMKALRALARATTTVPSSVVSCK